MTVEVTVQTVEPTPTAVVAATVTLAEFPAVWGPMLDDVWGFLRGAAPPGLYQHGHNIMLYRDDPAAAEVAAATAEVVQVEVGVQVTGPFPAAGRVVPSVLPGGLVATAAHRGPVSAIGVAHQAVREWSQRHGYRLAGPRWEVYGDPDPATGEFGVDVYWLLATP